MCVSMIPCHGGMMMMRWARGQPLGKGSQATVFMGVSDHPLHPYIAIKTSASAFSHSLRKEHFILSHLHGCPEVVRCIGAENSLADRSFNLFMELASAGTLSDVIQTRGGRLQEPEIRCFTRMLLRGLRAIHAKGYVHCDLKPANILAFLSFTDEINYGGADVSTQLKIGDFGLAKLPGEICINSSKYRGTPLYMSPESIKTGIIEPALDLWSLGCVVVEMFTGRPAINSLEDLDCMAYGLLSMEDMKAALIPESMSCLAKDFLEKCFAINPSERWTADGLLLLHPFVSSLMTDDVDDDLYALPPHLMAAIDFVLEEKPESSTSSSSSSSSTTAKGKEKMMMVTVIPESKPCSSLIGENFLEKCLQPWKIIRRSEDDLLLHQLFLSPVNAAAAINDDDTTAKEDDDILSELPPHLMAAIEYVLDDN